MKGDHYMPKDQTIVRCAEKQRAASELYTRRDEEKSVCTPNLQSQIMQIKETLK